MSRQKERTYYTAQVAIIIGFVLSLSIGFLDLLVSLLSERPGGLSSFSTILPPLLATIGFFFLIYLILWFLVVSHLGRFLKLGAIPLAVFLALFLLQFFALDLSNNLIRAYLSPINSFKLFAMFLIYLLISVGIYFFVKAVIQTSNYRNIIVTFGLTIPFVLAEAMVFVWLYKYRAGSFSSIPSFLIYLGYIIIFLLTVVLFYRIAQSVKVVRLLTIFMALVVLSPFVIWAVSRGYGVLSGAFKETDRQVRHVILLTVDTLRVDVLSCYDNQQSVPTPHIDQLAKDGVLFTKAISAAPWTLPSFSSIMTGLSPSVHMTTKSSSRLPDNLKTLAEYMRDSGYYTAAIGYNWFLRPDHNVSQGFLGYNFFPKSSLGKSFGVRLIKWSFPDKFRSEASTRDLTRLAINWLQSNYKKDFFLWIHYFDPHEPYVPPPRFLPKRKPPPGMGKEFDMKTKELRDGSYTPPIG